FLFFCVVRDPPRFTLSFSTAAYGVYNGQLRGPAGGGDVHLWPCGKARTVVELHSPYGLALLQFDTSDLRGFLLRTYAVVADGQEDVAAEVDRGLSALFGSV
ncbi:SsgA family sporulation/cell division regulator, partial [Streptomyces sp. S3(2020)]|nr:SsgA family sporulation/cell division regulator [Streptomyces sp. S3(2020)]